MNEEIIDVKSLEVGNHTGPIESAITPRLASRKELLVVAVASALLSLVSFVYFFNRGMTNVYGDGVAHVNISRKVVDHPDDSLWQRYVQIGTPWLPLQTVLMLPLVANDRMWRTGAAGSVVSMLFYTLAAIALYQLALLLYRDEDARFKKLAPAFACAVFLLNPNALYMQSTPMSELVFMGATLWAIFLLQRWAISQARRDLVIAAIAMTIATLSRYEAWPIAIASTAIVFILASGSLIERVGRSFLYGLIAAAGPLYWLWHNRAIYGDSLEFLTGPHSARGIFLQNQSSLGWSKVFVGNAPLDLLLMTATVAVIVGPLVLALAAAGFIRVIIKRRKALIVYLPSLLVAVPFFFHTLSLYRGEIQIFPLSAFGLLNVRYGLPHLLGVALFAPAAIHLFTRFGRRAVIAIFAMIVLLQYTLLLGEGPSQLAIYQEGFRNGVNSRAARERAKVASRLKENPPQGVTLMQTGSLGPVVSKSDLRFSDLIHEGAIGWHQIDSRIPDDVSTIILEQGDALDERIHKSETLARNFNDDFRLSFQVGKIEVYERK